MSFEKRVDLKLNLLQGRSPPEYLGIRPELREVLGPSGHLDDRTPFRQVFVAVRFSDLLRLPRVCSRVIVTPDRQLYLQTIEYREDYSIDPISSPKTMTLEEARNLYYITNPFIPEH